MKTFNTEVLMSGADYFSDAEAINPYMDDGVQVDVATARIEHESIKTAFEQAGIKVRTVPAPENCQDGVYTANWALIRNGKAIMSRLPNARKGEEPYAEQVLRGLGVEVVKVPDELRFSGQGDALPCGNYLFAGSVYRTDASVHQFLADTLGYEVISLQTKPLRSLHGFGKPVINSASGWPDSNYYDIDLALSVIRPDTPEERGLIAWCPAAFTRESVAKIRALPIYKIEVSKAEATKAFACNLVSTGETVVMSNRAPELRNELTRRGLEVLTLDITELVKGGGFIRCTSLTLDN